VRYRGVDCDGADGSSVGIKPMGRESGQSWIPIIPTYGLSFLVTFFSCSSRPINGESVSVMIDLVILPVAEEHLRERKNSVELCKEIFRDGRCFKRYLLRRVSALKRHGKMFSTSSRQHLVFTELRNIYEMSVQTCWRCRIRASDSFTFSRRPTPQPWLLIRSSTAPISTSAPLLALPPKKKSGVSIDKNVRSRKRTFTRKKVRPPMIDRSRKPAIGERKALRKRVVLSNTNALEVYGMQDLTAESFVDESLRSQVLGIPGPVVDQLRAVEAFKVTQGWPLFRRPAMLIRQETLDLGKELEGIGPGRSNDSIRRVLVGERGSGKTLMLLQAMTMAFLKGWVVINIPEGMF